MISLTHINLKKNLFNEGYNKKLSLFSHDISLHIQHTTKLKLLN